LEPIYHYPYPILAAILQLHRPTKTVFRVSDSTYFSRTDERTTGQRSLLLLR